MPEPTIPPILLVRLRPRVPNGTTVGESRRVCHLVPLPEAGEVPLALRAYCGTPITPGSADLLGEMAGMPCEACLAKSGIPAFAMLRALPITTGQAQAGGWVEHGLPPQTQMTARFVLLVLLQHPDRPVTIGQIAELLGQDPHQVHLILLIFTAIDWVQPIPEQTDAAWADRAYRLTEHGAPLARRMLAQGLTPTFVDLASALGLDTTIVPGPDALAPGGCSGSPGGAPHRAPPRVRRPRRQGGDLVTTPENPQDTWASAGSAVLDWIGTIAQCLQQVIHRTLSEYEPVTAARLSAPDQPVGGNAMVVAVVALVVAVAALGMVARTRRQVTARLAPIGRTDW